MRAKRPGILEDTIADVDHKNPPSRMPRCRSCVQSKKACDRQRPCDRCRAAGIGLEGCIGAEAPEREENQIAIENNNATSQSDTKINFSPRPSEVSLPGPSAGSKREIELSDEPQQSVAKRPRVDAALATTSRRMLTIKLPRCKRCTHANINGCDGQRPCSNCNADGIDVEGCTRSEKDGERQMGTDSDLTTMSNVTGPEKSPGLHRESMTFGSEMPRGDADERSSEIGDRMASADAKASLGGKRKREVKDTGIEAGSNATQMTRVPDQPASSKRRATRSSKGDRSTDGAPKPAAPEPKGIALGVPNVPSDNMATIADGTVVSNLPTDTQNREPDSDFEFVQGHKIDLGMFVRQMKKLQQDVELTALDILACIGRIQNMPCPLDLNPSEHLAALYRRCWGAEWKECAANAVKDGSFRTPFNMMSLISAFLYNKIFNKQAYNKEVAQDLITQLQASGPTGEAILKALDWSRRGKCILARNIDKTTDALQLQSSRSLRPCPLSRSKEQNPYGPKMKPPFVHNCKRKQRPK